MSSTSRLVLRLFVFVPTVLLCGMVYADALAVVDFIGTIHRFFLPEHLNSIANAPESMLVLVTTVGLFMLAMEIAARRLSRQKKDE